MVVTKVKQLSCLALFTSLFAISAIAENKDLILVNNLQRDLSFKIYSKEGNHCSSEFGVLTPDSYNKVGPQALIKSCPNPMETCIAYVQLSDNCSGDSIAFVTYSGYSGIESLVLNDVRQGTPDIQAGKYHLIFRGFK